MGDLSRGAGLWPMTDDEARKFQGYARFGFGLEDK
jgi:hypothetical protein